MKIPNWSVPLAIVLLIVISLKASSLFAIPSLTIDVVDPETTRDVPTEIALLVVNGVKCVSTAKTASLAVVSKKGIVRFVAYASRNRLEITYDPRLLKPADITDAIEGPIYDRETGQFLFNQFNVLEMNGEAVH